MPLGKYVSNSNEVNKELLARGLIKMPPTECKILGMSINLKVDSLIVNLPNFNITKPTLTSVLSDHASVWDVVGFIEPVRVASKAFINSLHKDKLDWKDHLNDTHIENWIKIVKLFKSNAEGFFPRMCTVNPGVMHTLHVFTDASGLGYGGVAHVTSHSGNASSYLLCAKSKLKNVASLSKIS